MMVAERSDDRKIKSQIKLSLDEIEELIDHFSKFRLVLEHLPGVTGHSGHLGGNVALGIDQDTQILACGD